MNPFPSHEIRWAMAAAVGIAVLFVSLLGAVPAMAQEVNCERVPYNERIIVVCKSGESDTADSNPTPTTEAGDDDPEGADEDSDSEDGDVDTADNDDDESSTTESDDDQDDDGSNGVDRGDRGGRTGGAEGASNEIDIDRAGSSSGETDEPDTAGDSDAGESVGDGGSTGPLSGADDEQLGDGSEVDSRATTGRTVAPTADEPDALPLAAGLAALTLGGAAFFLAARRSNTSSIAMG